MNVLLALSLIFIFYYLFILNDRITAKNDKQEHFSENENEKLLQDIDSYVKKRITDIYGSSNVMKTHINMTDVSKDNFQEPVVINRNVEANETKIMSDSPVYVPTNLYVDGSFTIENKDGNSKNLCMGENCYSEKDILYIIQDLLPYYKYVSRNSNDKQKLCFESYDTLNSIFDLPELETISIREGLDYTEKLRTFRDIVRNYDFDFSNRNIDSNLIAANSLRTDYNVIYFLQLYPELIGLFNQSIDKSNTANYLNNLKNNTISQYNRIKNNVNSKNNSITNKNCISGDELSILRGDKDIKLETKDLITNYSSNLNAWEGIQTSIVDDMRRWFKNNGQLKRSYGGESNVQIYNNSDIYYDNSVKGSNLTEYPYLNEQHFEVHGINDDDDDCMNYKKLKIATMSKSKNGDEKQRNGSFKMELVDGKSGETGVFCKPE